MPFAVCMLKERKGALITTKCGRTKGVVVQDTTAWWREVTCPKCKELMNVHESTSNPEPNPVAPDNPVAAPRRLVRLQRPRRKE